MTTSGRNLDDRPGRRCSWRRPRVLVPAGVIGGTLLTAGLVVFEPWTLVVDHRVDEAVSVSLDANPTAGPDDAPTSPDARPTRRARPSRAATPRPKLRDDTPKPTGPVTLLEGRFVSHEHGTSGRATVLKLADGSRLLRIHGLDTSNGPDLRVWLADAPVRKGREGWFIFDDGRHLDLGRLKGNLGNQNYAVPADADLDSLRSVSIWCARFRVSFGAAALT